MDNSSLHMDALPGGGGAKRQKEKNGKSAILSRCLLFIYGVIWSGVYLDLQAGAATACTSIYSKHPISTPYRVLH